MAQRARRKRKTRERDATEFLLMVGRMIRAAGRRVGDADEPELALLLQLRDQLDFAIVDAVELQRDHGKTWAMIALATGTTRQSAQERFTRKSA